ATVVNGSEIPIRFRYEPNKPLRPNAINNANPATEGGRTMGKSINNSIHDLYLIFQFAKT
ncbi:hypothetical protein ACYTX7_10380, partial [Streptococcus pyogenes]